MHLIYILIITMLIDAHSRSNTVYIYTIHHTSLQLTPASYSSTARWSPRTVRPDVPWLTSGSVNGTVITATVRVSYSLGYISESLRFIHPHSFIIKKKWKWNASAAIFFIHVVYRPNINLVLTFGKKLNDLCIIMPFS